MPHKPLTTIESGKMPLLLTFDIRPLASGLWPLLSVLRYPGSSSNLRTLRIYGAGNVGVLEIYNKTGEMGVSRIIKTGPNGTKHECYVAHWSSKEKGRRSASFAVPKYGEEKAFKMAVTHRRKMMRELLGQTEYRKYLKAMLLKQAGS